MEPYLFDDFTKSLAASTSRRQVMKTIAAATLGGILGLSGIGEAFARSCKHLGNRCKKTSDCCGVMTCGSHHTCTCPSIGGIQQCDNVNCFCQSGQICDSNHFCCPDSQYCTLSGQCCVAGKSCCDGNNCVDLSSDDNNCGRCGNKCSGSEICIGGSCQCVPPYTTCGGTCVDTDTDPNNCGGCGFVCGGGSGTCSNGICCVPCTNPNNPTCCATVAGQPICCIGYPSVNAVCSTEC